MHFFHKISPIFILITLLTHSICEENDISSTIIEICKLRKTQNVAVIMCSHRMTQVKMLKDIASHSIRASVLNYDQFISKMDTVLLDNKLDSMGIVVYMNCPNLTLVLDEIMEYSHRRRIFKANFKWTFLGETPDALEFFKRADVDVDAEVLHVEMTTYNVYEVYNTGKKNYGTFRAVPLGTLGGERETLTRALKKYKYARRSNMTGVILKCMVVATNEIHVKFEDYLTMPFDRHLDSMNRFNYALLLHLRDMYNFQYDLMRTNSWGYSHNGTFDGMVGQLERGLVDIGGSPIFFRLERAKVVDYTIQTWIARPCFIFRHPERTSSVLVTYIRPFTNRVWYCTIGLAILILVVVYLLDKCSKIDTRGLYLLDVVGIILNQGTENNFHTLSGKITMITICIFSILFYQFYSASIVSALLMQPPKTIKTLDDLLKSSISVGIENIPYTIDYFAKTDDPIAIKLYTEKIINPRKSNLLNPKDGLAIVKRGGYAFHVDVATAYKIIRDTFSEDEICQLSEIQLFPPQRMLAIVQKGSPYRKLVTYGLRKISEVGLMAREKSVWHEKKPACNRGVNSSKFKVTMKEFSSVLISLLGGVVASLIFLMVEIKRGSGVNNNKLYG